MPLNDLDPDGIDKAAKACEEKGCVIVYGGPVKKINETNGGESKRTLIVSDTFITFVKKPLFPSLSHTRSWSDLVSVKTIDNNGLELKFKKNNKDLQFRFRSRERAVIIRKIVDLLYHTLTPTELSGIDLDFQHPIISINPRGVFSRFDEHLTKSGMILTDSKLREPFRLYCQTLQPNCILKSIETAQEMKALFYALMGAYFTKAVFFPQIKNEELVEKMFKYFGFFVNSPATIEFFSFKNAITSKFDGFINSILEKSETPINGIGFRDVEMTEENIEKVNKVVGEKNFFSLRWCNISPVTSTESLLKDRKVRKSLRFLALDGSKGINFRRIAPRLSHIAVLSLQYSGLEIADVFNIINKNNLDELKMIDLSFNNASKPFGPSTVIPSKLQRIDISHVKFSNNTMKNILEVILTADYEKGLRFYCDKYHDEDEEIDDALSNFQKITSNDLKEFSWRKNKVDENLLNFLKRSPHLEKLILERNIYNTEEEKNVEEFAAILPSLNNLTHLYICGSKKCELGSDFENQLLVNLKKLPKLTYLDISGNSISDQGIESIAFSLKDFSSLTHIILDNNNITSIDPLMKLVEKAQQLHKKLFISWPLNDIKSLLRDEKVTETNLSDLRKRFNNASTGLISLPINRQTMTLDDGVVIDSKNSSSVRNKSGLTGKQRKQKGGSVFIRAGSVRNLKRALTEGDDREQDPDSIFIQPFDVWYGDINDNNFPLYLTEQLVDDFDIQKYDPEADIDNDETEFNSEYSEEQNESPKAIKSRSINHSNDSEEQIETPKTIQSRTINVSNKSDSGDQQIERKYKRQINSDISEDEEDNDDKYAKRKRTRQNNFSDSDDEAKSNQQNRKYVKAPPPLRPVDEVLNSSSKRQTQQSPSASRRNNYSTNDDFEDESGSRYRNQNRLSSSSYKINNNDDEQGEVKERDINIDQKANNKVSDEDQLLSPKNTSSQRYKKKAQKFPSPNYSQIQKHNSRSVTKAAAPALDIDESELADVAFGDQIDEAEQFEAPSWSFPVPRVSRVSNGSFLSDLNEKYSVASVINDLRSKK